MIGGLELHPAIVHFPIALTVVGALGALAYLFVPRDWLRWFAPILLSLALFGAGAAYFSGKAAEDRAEAIGVPEAAIEQHERNGSLGARLRGPCLLPELGHPLETSRAVGQRDSSRSSPPASCSGMGTSAGSSSSSTGRGGSRPPTTAQPESVITSRPPRVRTSHRKRNIDPSPSASYLFLGLFLDISACLLS